MSDYSKARGVHSIVTPSERADPLQAKNRSRLIAKLARLNHQKLLLERLNRVWVEQQQATLARLHRLEAQIDAIHAVTGIAMVPKQAPAPGPVSGASTLRSDSGASAPGSGHPGRGAGGPPPAGPPRRGRSR